MTEEFQRLHQEATKQALKIIEEVRAGKHDVTEEEFVALVDDAYDIIMSKLHLLRHAGLENGAALAVMARALSCDAKADGLDLSPEEALVAMWVAMEQHKILFVDEHIQYELEG